MSFKTSLLSCLMDSTAAANDVQLSSEQRRFNVGTSWRWTATRTSRFFLSVMPKTCEIWTSHPVWSDDGIKSCTFSPKTCQKSSHGSMYLKCDPFQYSSECLQIFGLLLHKNWSSRTLYKSPNLVTQDSHRHGFFPGSRVTRWLEYLLIFGNL